MTAPPLRRSPLHDAHVAAGAAFTDFAGWEMPVRYSSDLAEHAAVRERAGLFDLSHMGEIVVLGPQAADALDHAVSGRMSGLAEGQARYTLLLAPDGGILDDLVVYRTGPDRFLVVANAANRELVAAELRERSAPFDALVEDESDDIALIALQGPRAEEIVRAVTGFDIPALDDLGYYRATTGNLRGHEVLVARTGYTGEDGFEFFLAPDAAPGLWEALLQAGSGPVPGPVPAGLAARDTLRLEAGMPLHGHELTRETHPAEAGVGRAVQLADGRDFVGRDAVAGGARAGAPVLVGLAGEGRRAARAGYPVLSDGAPVGEVTSGALSPTLGHPIAMARVAASSAVTGTVLDVDVRGTALPMTVVPLPFRPRPARSAPLGTPRAPMSTPSTPTHRKA